MYWMDAAGLYTAEPSTQKLQKAPEINALTLRTTFVISRSCVRVTLLAPRRVPDDAERRLSGTFLRPKVQTKRRVKPLDPNRDPNADRSEKHGTALDMRQMSCTVCFGDVYPILCCPSTCEVMKPPILFAASFCIALVAWQYVFSVKPAE